MLPSVIVCNGCCCGRVEKGNKKVPIEALRVEWKKHGLEEKVNLMISGCLGPCRMNNVSILRTEQGQTWLGKLTEEKHYQALVGWACDITTHGNQSELPDVLLPLRFDGEK